MPGRRGGPTKRPWREPRQGPAPALGEENFPPLPVKSEPLRLEANSQRILSISPGEREPSGLERAIKEEHPTVGTPSPQRRDVRDCELPCQQGMAKETLNETTEMGVEDNGERHETDMGVTESESGGGQPRLDSDVVVIISDEEEGEVPAPLDLRETLTRKRAISASMDAPARKKAHYVPECPFATCSQRAVSTRAALCSIKWGGVWWGAPLYSAHLLGPEREHTRRFSDAIVETTTCIAVLTNPVASTVKSGRVQPSVELPDRRHLIRVGIPQ